MNSQPMKAAAFADGLAGKSISLCTFIGCKFIRPPISRQTLRRFSHA